jgi:stage II sporulation protein D
MDGRVQKLLLQILKIIFIFSLVLQASLAQDSVKIHVRIAKGLSKILLKGTDLVQTYTAKNEIFHLAGRRTFEFSCVSRNGFQFPREPLALTSISSATGILKWEDRPYRGELSIVTSDNQNQCDLIQMMDLEHYLSTLLAKEMNANWPIEALKAQAVAARSYAYHKIITDEESKKNGYKTHFHLENSERHQVSGHFEDANSNTDRATYETRGEILTSKRGEILPIFFHSKCGGKTVTPEHVWSNRVDGYVEVECKFCHKHGQKTWQHSMSKTQFKQILLNGISKYYNQTTTMRDRLQMMPDDESERDFKIIKNGKPIDIKKAVLRKILGRTEIKSNNFRVHIDGERVSIVGEGNGHGVGLCQFGALELAQRGYKYKDILQHYFPNHVFKKIY